MKTRAKREKVYENLKKTANLTFKTNLAKFGKRITNFGSNIVTTHSNNFHDSSFIDNNYKEEELEEAETESKEASLNLDNDILSSKVVKQLLENYKKEVNKLIINSLYKHLNMDETIPKNMKQIEQMMQEKGLLKESTSKYINSVKHLEHNLKLIETVLNKLKQKELNRISKEFYQNDYERRFNVKQEIVISALIGEDNTMAELFKQRKEKRNFISKLEDVKMYNMFSS